MSKVLVIGCGGVATVAIHKCCQVSEIFTELCISSRQNCKAKPPPKLPQRRWMLTMLNS